MEKVLAISDKGKGLLSMKQGKEQEAKKTVDRKHIEICNFIKNAFCLDGDVEMVLTNKPITSKIFFRCNDSKRGKFWVAYGDLDHTNAEDSEE